MTPRGRALLLSALLLWAAGRTLGVPELAMAAVGALALLGLAVLATRWSATVLTVERHLRPARLFHDRTGEVELRVTNVGRFTSGILQLDDGVPGALTDRARFVVQALGPGQQALLSYPVHGRARGRHVIAPLRVAVRDPFGLATRTRQLGTADELVVYPAVWELPHGVPLGGQHGTGSEGAARPLAQGDELATVREYVRGDDLRKVHWHSTAHRGRLMIRQDEAPQYPQATVLVDLRADRHAGSGAASTFEVALSAAASAAYHLAQRRYGVRLALEPVTTAPLVERPWQEQLAVLAIAEPRSDVDLLGLQRQLSKGAGGDGGLLAIITVPRDTELRELVRAGRAFTSRAAIVVAPLRGSSSRGQRQEVDVRRTEAALRAASWRVAVVRPGERLDHRWHELLAQRARSRT